MRGAQVDESIALRSLSGGEAASRLMAIAANHGLRVESIGPTAYRLTRTVRTLLVPSDESCAATVENGLSGPAMRLVGKLPGQMLTEVRAALSGATATPTPPPTVTSASVGKSPSRQPVVAPAPPPSRAPVWEGPDISSGDADGILRRLAPDPTAAPVNTAPVNLGAHTQPKTRNANGGWLARLADGRVVTLGPLVLIGRDPAAAPGEIATNLVPVNDPNRSVSKTHLALGTDPHGAWVCDRHSVNGTVVVDPAGRTINCPAGQRMYLAGPSTVHLGDLTLEVRPA